MERIKLSESSRCLDQDNQPMLTLIDYRTENFLKTDRPIPSIRTKCKLIRCLFDDLIDPTIRDKIPKEGLVIAISETGNRDWAVMRYLYRWGYTNVAGIEFGMRGWIMSGYLVDIPKL